MKTILYIIIKELLQLKRDPKMFAIILIAPVIQLTFLGYAVNMDVEKVATVVFNQDKTIVSRDFLNNLSGNRYFEFVDYVDNYNDLQNNIDNGTASLALVIPNNFEKKLQLNKPISIQAIFDGSDGNKASITAGYLQKIVGEYSIKIIKSRIQKGGKNIIPIGQVTPEIRAWYNPELSTRVYMIPGIVGLLLSIITLILTSLAIVKEREIGTLEQIIVTPIKPIQLILGKLIPFAILGFVAVIIVLLAMTFIFGITPRGSILFLFLSTFLYILSTLGLGLFVSTVSKTQQQAMMLAIFVVLMPMIFLSGFAFPIENMPQIIQAITYIIPLRYFMTIIRGIILKGVGFYEVWFELFMLFLIGVTVLTLSSLRFKKRMD
ncbi:MAG: ABC transporter permease [Bacteroidetes bacterium]|nr:ABC transporter permease [Bacteroidota bacterium]MBU1113819.1 ABC transporter permease [Bacteroidota bacterium]MBU1799595.1 ABC transporter permease [Bacteroidota bacterium]